MSFLLVFIIIWCVRTLTTYGGYRIIISFFSTLSLRKLAFIMFSNSDMHVSVATKLDMLCTRKKNTLKNVVCEMASILSRRRCVLTHWSRVKHICLSKLKNLKTIGSNNGLSPWPAPSHDLNQCWNIVNWTPENKVQWNLNQNLYICIQKNCRQEIVGHFVSVSMC